MSPGAATTDPAIRGAAMIRGRPISTLKKLQQRLSGLFGGRGGGGSGGGNASGRMSGALLASLRRAPLPSGR